jgi:hypothetical protein
MTKDGVIASKSGLPGTRGGYLRLMAGVGVGGCVSLLCQTQVQSHRFSIVAVTVLAFCAGITTLWSP